MNILIAKMGIFSLAPVTRIIFQNQILVTRLVHEPGLASQRFYLNKGLLNKCLARNSINQLPGIIHLRIKIYIIRFAGFYNFSFVHYKYTIADIMYH